MSITRRQLKWDRRFLSVAELISSWSKDPSTGVGCVIADPRNRVVSLGFNGLPRQVKDAKELIEERSVKLETTIHAEVNAILFARRDLTGCTLYSYPLFPCSRCAGLIIQSGIARVVAPVQEESAWAESFELSRKLFREALVLVDLIRPDSEA